MSIYGILSEDPSDRETIKTILRKLLADPRLVALGRDFGGKGNLFRHGARELRSLSADGCNRFVVCVDADQDDPEALREKVSREIILPSKVRQPACIAIPVRAIEAWILADIDAAMTSWKKHTGWRPGEVKQPEKLQDPKSEIKRLSCAGGSMPRYSPPNDNPRIAAHLNLVRVLAKCPSFRSLHDFVHNPP